MTHTTSISFVRHGQVYNPYNLFYGRSDGFPISELGRQQALVARDFLERLPISAFYSSPMLRARQTAEIILEPHEGASLIVDELLNETKSPYDGQPSSVVEALNWDIYAGVGIEYEQPQDVLSRGLKFIDNVLRDHPGQHVVAVTHRDLIVFLFLWHKGQPITASEKLTVEKSFISPGSISTFTIHIDLQDSKPEFSYVD